MLFSGLLIPENKFSTAFEACGMGMVIFSIFIYFKNQKTNQIEEYNFKLFKDIFSNLPDASVIYSLENKNVVFDNAMTQKHFEDASFCVEKILNSFPQVDSFNLDISNIEINFDTKEHKDVPFLISLRHLNTNKKHIIITMKCIKEMKEKDNYIKSQNESLVESSRFTALGEMASGFAHEINNPLTIILGNLSIMKIQLDMGKFNEEKFNKCLDKSNDSIQRIVKTIKSLQKLANTKEDKQLHSVKEVVEVCESHISLIEEQEKKPFQADINVFVDKEQQLSLNLNQVSQSLGHIIKNAIEACLANGDEVEAWIQIDINENDKDLIIDIIDSGVGIDKSMKEKVFNPMYTTKIEQNGAGIGLSLSRSFITHNQGSIELITNAKHTTFRIHLPFYEELKNMNAA